MRRPRRLAYRQTQRSVSGLDPIRQDVRHAFGRFSKGGAGDVLREAADHVAHALAERLHRAPLLEETALPALELMGRHLALARDRIERRAGAAGRVRSFGSDLQTPCAEWMFITGYSAAT